MNKKATTENRLRSRVFQTSLIIEQRYDEELKVSELAETVGMSVSHLQAVFKDIVGESIIQHINRLRAEYAASLLVYSSWAITDIGLACGFSSASGFSRGFKHVFGVSPLQFRNTHQSIPFLKGYFRSKPHQKLEDPNVPLPTVRFQQWPQLTVVCLRYYGPVSGVYKPWKEMLKWVKNNEKSLLQSRFLGLWFDDWYNKDDQHYRYECAIVLPEGMNIEVPQPFFIRIIPEGNTAISNVRGGVKVIDHAWHCFANGWLPFSGYQPRLNYVIDQYSNDFITQTPIRQFASILKGDISMKMCIPLQKEPISYY